MPSIMILIAIVLPIGGAIAIPLLLTKSRRWMEWYTELLTIVTSVLVWALLLHTPDQFTILSFSEKVSFSLQIDGLGKVFAGLISVLWPLATLYSFEYMCHEERQRPFFMFYIMTYGVTLGISFSANLLTMYCFYEALTLITVPLVIHTFTREAVLATHKYIYYSMGGAALGFIAVVIMIKYGTGANFTIGGTLDASSALLPHDMLLLLYVLAFLGFSIKAAMFPFYAWIPDAGVAPTPVTALLHAVAVVKAGAFAVARLTYYSFGTEILKGTWAQTIVMCLAMFTIVFGCSMAVKETHMKRRLAFSTVANLSYIIFGVTVMTPESLSAGLSHMVFHAIMKISAFFCVGAIMHQTHKNFVHETDGFGKKMPWVYAAFTVSAIGMMGVPGTAGFISKWNLASAALNSGNRIAYFGVAALLVSALLTAIYMMTMVIRGFFPRKDFDMDSISTVKDPTWKMIVPLMVFSVAIIAFGVFAVPLMQFLNGVAWGLQ